MTSRWAQSSYVLVDRPIAPDALEKALDGAWTRLSPEGPWQIGEPALERDRVVVDVLAQRWPDGLGDPRKEPELFQAWQAGAFGPCVHPLSLERARQHGWAFTEGKRLAGKHTGSVRLRARARDDDDDALADLLHLTELALRLLERLEGALCYWNPNGESLRGKDVLADTLARHRSGGPPPFEVWSNVRLHAPTEARGWELMDTVGMEQLGVADQEVGFPKGSMEHGLVDDFLRSAALYLFEEGPVIEDHDTMKGPGLELQAYSYETGLVPPSRETLRWLPVSPRPPEALLESE